MTPKIDLCKYIHGSKDRQHNTKLALFENNRKTVHSAMLLKFFITHFNRISSRNYGILLKLLNFYLVSILGEMCPPCWVKKKLTSLTLWSSKCTNQHGTSKSQTVLICVVTSNSSSFLNIHQNSSNKVLLDSELHFTQYGVKQLQLLCRALSGGLPPLRALPNCKIGTYCPKIVTRLAFSSTWLLYPVKLH